MDLFDDLYHEYKSNSTRLTNDQKSATVHFIKNNKDKHEDIYRIIKLYELQQKDTNLYKSKILKSGGIRVNLESLPPPLQQMVHSLCIKKTQLVF